MTTSALRRVTAAFLTLSIALAMPVAALAAGTHSGGHAEEIGRPGDPEMVSRTIEVEMHDNYYEPEGISVEAGETVRFVVRNLGQLVHEFNIATAAMHEAHRPEMMMMMEHGVLRPDAIDRDAAEKMQKEMGHGMHEEPNSVLLEPGQTAEIVWTFPDHADLEFACNVPGHYEAGMVGDVELNR